MFALVMNGSCCDVQSLWLTIRMVIVRASSLDAILAQWMAFRSCCGPHIDYEDVHHSNITFLCWFTTLRHLKKHKKINIKHFIVVVLNYERFQLSTHLDHVCQMKIQYFLYV